MNIIEIQLGTTIYPAILNISLWGPTENKFSFLEPYEHTSISQNVLKQIKKLGTIQNNSQVHFNTLSS